MAQYSFGTGTLYAVGSASNSTPVRFGGLQNVDVEFSFGMKELYGQKQFPLTVARGAGKVTGKAAFAQLNGNTFNDLFFGQTMTTGQLATAVDEAATIPATPYAATVANSATFDNDLGVVDASSGAPMMKVASAPAAGQYSVASGVYTFAAADTGKAVLISYTYSVAANGNKIVINNQLLGVQPTFMIDLTQTYAGKSWTLKLNACVSSKLALPTKREDFTLPALDFSAMADASGVVGTLSMVE